jgi:hypothetical protein
MSELRQSIPRLTMKKSGFDFIKKPPSRDPKTLTKTGGLDVSIKVKLSNILRNVINLCSISRGK